jgi:L-lactate dehydrogenase complex protein LldG
MPDKKTFLATVQQATGRDPLAKVPPPPAPSGRSAPLNEGELVQRFALALKAALARAHLHNSAREARETLRGLLQGTPSYARTSHPVLDEIGTDEVAADLAVTLAGPETATVAVTGCDYAVAATGSVAMSSIWGRAVTLLPPKHIVVVRSSQILPDIDSLYFELARRDLPAAWGMHTGPSRSADIEQTMALGVHGPGSVDVLVITQE